MALELGGKSPNVILDDADLQEAITDGVAKCFLNSGQTCSALTRMLVPRERLGEAEQIAAAVAEYFTPGDPFDPEAKLGPLVSAAQRERVRGYIARGQEEGAKLLTGGAEPPAGLERGYFVAPTVFCEVTPEMTIAQEEIFGPVLVLMPYDDEDGRGADRQRHRLRAGRRRVVGRRGASQARGPPDPHRPGRDQRRARSTRRLRSAASSSPATAGSSDASAWRSSWP